MDDTPPDSATAFVACEEAESAPSARPPNQDPEPEDHRHPARRRLGEKHLLARASAAVSGLTEVPMSAAIFRTVPGGTPQPRQERRTVPPPVTARRISTSLRRDPSSTDFLQAPPGPPIRRPVLVFSGRVIVRPPPLSAERFAADEPGTAPTRAFTSSVLLGEGVEQLRCALPGPAPMHALMMSSSPRPRFAGVGSARSAGEPT